mmetsp:Transcript_7687/g.10898  ORF Transcript_7687/g.10898 Transcript_7687/m.10898 type:complete len:469 (-) Transcript_7687:113-1519(-)
MACQLTTADFATQKADGPLLDATWKCRVPGCGKVPGEHPTPTIQDKQWLLNAFRWTNEGKFAKDEGNYFPIYGFGKYVFKRQGIIDEVFSAIDNQLELQPLNSTSVYLTGCRGSGKTSNLMLIARDLKSKNWEVYFFSSAAAIPDGAGAALTAYAVQNKNKKIAVMVDDVGSNPESHLFIDLLKGQLPNVLTVGAAVGQFYITCNFRKKLHTSDLVLREGDQDVLDLIAHWKTKEVASPEMVVHVSMFLLNHCGGHVYPVLAFMEYVFTHPEAKEYLADEKEFRKHLYSDRFAQGEVYREVCNRCFGDGVGIDPDLAKTFMRVMSDRVRDHDIHTLTQLGLWDWMKQGVLSALLLNACLDHLKPANMTETHLDRNCGQELNLENLIIESLNAVEPHELAATNCFLENKLSFNWACRVKARCIDVHLEFQKPFPHKLMNVFTIDNIVAGLEILCDADGEGWCQRASIMH